MSRIKKTYIIDRNSQNYPILIKLRCKEALTNNMTMSLNIKTRFLIFGVWD